MKSISSLVCCLVLALCAAGCWVPELPDNTLFICDTAADCAAEGVVCAPRVGDRGYCCTPTAEVCNGKDDNCDGQLDNLANPPTEVCNGLDDDCDGKADEDFNFQTDIAHCGGCGT